MQSEPASAEVVEPQYTGKLAQYALTRTASGRGIGLSAVSLPHNGDVDCQAGAVARQPSPALPSGAWDVGLGHAWLGHSLLSCGLRVWRVNAALVTRVGTIYAYCKTHCNMHTHTLNTGGYPGPSQLLLSLAKHHFMLDHSMLVYDRRIGQGSYGTVFLGALRANLHTSGLYAHLEHPGVDYQPDHRAMEWGPRGHQDPQSQPAGGGGGHSTAHAQPQGL